MNDFDFLQEAPAGQSDQPAKNAASLNRRDFFKIGAAATGGLLLSLSLPPLPSAAAPSMGEAGAFVPNVFLRIDPDDAITITVHRSEMGQGIRTSLAMLLAEELCADWSRVRIEQAPYDEKYGPQGTGGSGSVRSLWMPFRRSGASARAMLISAAARTWGVEETSCHADRGAVIHASTGRTLRFGELAGQAARLNVPENPPLKDPAQFSIIGKAQKGVDVPDIITGKAVYGSDVRVPGMLYAVVERSPVYGGSVANFEASRAQAVAGVQKVFEVPAVGRPAYVPSGVAVVATSTWAALSGRSALQVTWDEGPYAEQNTASLLQEMKRVTGDPCNEVRSVGDADAVLQRHDDRIEAAYEMPFLSHATMEPMNCTAHVEGDRCTIWAPTQNPGAAAERVAQALDIPKENVTVQVTLMGGGFGRRLWSDFAAEAALVSRLAGAPVKVIWTREDDMKHGFYRPMNYHRLSAVLDEAGNPTALRHRIASTSIAETTAGPDATTMHGSEVGGASNVPYRIPHHRCEFANVSAAVTRGWWRSVAHSHTTFAVESFIDELAAAAGKDPYLYRLQLIDEDVEVNPENPYALNPTRLKAVLQAAAEKAGWGSSLPAGRGRGIACQFSFASYAAEVFEVSVDASGVPRVHRVVAVIDCGTLINPDGARAQVEGSIIDGLSAALHGEVTLSGGRVDQGNFDDYPLLRMNEIPEKLEIHFVDSGAAPTGLGEPAFPPVSPALANAIFAATGKRVRKLPVQPAELRS